jgi:hypothetical protein
MIQLWLDTLSLSINSDRIITFETPNLLGMGVEYSVVGVPLVKGVKYESKFLWQGISVLLTQDQLNTLQLIRTRADILRRSQSAFAIGFYNTVFPFTEDPPRTRAIIPDTEETENDSGSITYFPQYVVWIENIKASILGDWRSTTFDLIELEKVLS